MILPKELRHKIHDYSQSNEIRKAYADGMVDAVRWFQDNEVPVIVDEEPVITPTIPKRMLTFEGFWDAYQKKVGRPKCEKLWSKLTMGEKQLAMDYIPKYIAAQPDKQFRKNPETFLRNKSWNDEIIQRNNGRQQPVDTNEAERQYLEMAGRNLFSS